MKEREYAKEREWKKEREREAEKSDRGEEVRERRKLAREKIHTLKLFTRG